MLKIVLLSYLSTTMVVRDVWFLFVMIGFLRATYVGLRLWEQKTTAKLAATMAKTAFRTDNRTIAQPPPTLVLCGDISPLHNHVLQIKNIDNFDAAKGCQVQGVITLCHF